jgi:threonine dehydrogenase-like Zn-dependent dehydrogenase
MNPTVTMPTMSMSFLHRRVVSTLCPSGRDRLEHLLAVLQHRKIDLGPLFTHHMKLADAPRAYDLFRDKTEGVLKIAIAP